MPVLQAPENPLLRVVFPTKGPTERRSERRRAVANRDLHVLVDGSTFPQQLRIIVGVS